MNFPAKYQMTRNLALLYSATVLLLAASSFFSNELGNLFLRPISIPILFLLYVSMAKRLLLNYVLALTTVGISNIFMIWNTEASIFYTILFFTMFRIFTIIIIFKNINIIRPFACLLASLPFLCGFLYLISLTAEGLGANIYLAVFNAVFISLLVGIALAKYIFDENIENTWLLISLLFLAVNNVIFVLDNYFFYNEFFKPIGIILFGIGQYGFLRYVVLTQKSDDDRFAHQG